MTSSSPNRRHAVRATARKWEDVSEWPFHCIILPILVAFAFCLVLFLGSKQGVRLAAVRTWLPTAGAPSECTGPNCNTQAIALDIEGGILVGGSSSGGGSSSSSGSAGGGSGAAGLQGALQGITGLMGLDRSRSSSAAASAPEDTAALPLSEEDRLKFDFRFWIAEGAKLVGSQSRECDALYGLPYIERWRKARVSWCVADAAAASQATRTLSSSSSSSSSSSAPTSSSSPTTSRKLASSHAAASMQAPGDADGTTGGSSASKDSAAAVISSSIDLYPYTDKAAKVMFAASRNTVVDSSTFLGSLPSGMPAAPAGSYRAACRLGGAPDPGPELLGVEAVRRWMKDALQTEAYENVTAACAAAVSASNTSAAAAAAGSSRRVAPPVSHPVLLLSRRDPTNAFHSLEEMMTTFVTLAVLDDPDLLRQGLQVVLADGRPDGFFLDVWAALSRPYPLRLLARQPWPADTCLTRAVHNTFAESSLFTSMGVEHRTTCRSSLAMGAALWLRHMLSAAIQPPLHSPFKVPLQTQGVVHKTVVWISRRNFEGVSQGSLTSWQDQRRFSNEGEVVLELQREVWRWNDEACLRSGLPKTFSDTRALRLRRLRGLMAQLRGGGGAEGGMELSEQAASASSERVEGAWRQDGSATQQQQEEEALVGQQQRHRQRQGHEREEKEEEEEALLHGLGSLQGGSGRSGSGGTARRLHATHGSRCRQSNVFFELRVAELSGLPLYPDQLQLLGRAALLAGAHGAGLANMVWLPPGAGGVLELQHNSAGNEHFHNLAHLLGHKYVNVESDGDLVELPEVAAGLRKLLDMLGS